MPEAPPYLELARAAGISPSYAHEIVKGRKPPANLAIHIYRRTGWRHSMLAGLTEEQMAGVEMLKPWRAVADQAA